MATLEPVEHDPFAGNAPQLEPVEHDPFATPNAYADFAKQLAAGAVTGVENVASAPATLAGLAGRGADYLANKFAPGMVSPEAQANEDRLKMLIAANRGGGIADYLPAPQTTAGQVARTGAEFVTPMLGLTGGLARDVATGAASALGSEGLGRAFKGTQAEPIARGVGAVTGGLAGAKTGAGRIAANVTAEELKAAARPTFEEAARIGNTIAVPGEDIAKSIGSDLHEAALRQSNAPRTYRELTRLSGAEDLNDVAIARDKMRDIANGISDNRLIRVSGSDSTAARNAMNALDAQIEQLSPGWVPTMKEADANWAAAKRAETIAKEAEKNRLGSFGNNESRAKGFTPAEIAAVKRAHQGGTLRAGLNAIGGGLNPFHGGLTGAIAAAAHAPAAYFSGGTSLLGIPAGMLSDAAAAALRRRALDQATQQVLARSPLAQSRGAVTTTNDNALLAALQAAQAQRPTQ
jgi:hypothetical protein